MWQLVVIIVLGILIGSALGFVIGMRFNKKFNRFVRESSIGRRMTLSNNDMLKNTLSLTDFGDWDIDGEVSNNKKGYYGSTEEQKPLNF